MARSSYYYALMHPKSPPRPEVRGAIGEMFSQTPNGCGHRQITMCLRAERGARIADKTVLKAMRGMGVSCGIRRETDYHKYNSCKGLVGEAFENVLGRDFGSKEIVAWSVSKSASMAQRHDILDQLFVGMPKGVTPILHSDMGWQHQQRAWAERLGARRRAEHVEEGQPHRQRGYRVDLRPH